MKKEMKLIEVLNLVEKGKIKSGTALRIFDTETFRVEYTHNGLLFRNMENGKVLEEEYNILGILDRHIVLEEP